MCEELVFVGMMVTVARARARQGPAVAARGAGEALVQGILSTKAVVSVGATLIRSGSGSLGSVSVTSKEVLTCCNCLILGAL